MVIKNHSCGKKSNLGLVWCFGLLIFFVCVVVEAKDGTISVASAFPGHQEGNILNSPLPISFF